LFVERQHRLNKEKNGEIKITLKFWWGKKFKEKEIRGR